ncbi:uncharacterized protein LOC124931333 [Impatiens glandulifera]|uniref:uncharacterized protein LOC124931333 n=1 Tax=Impatiens glandulifera TaxID=253017 RepID=UPI001FB19BF1|nr:uncharacterized protein LOC124931333 [Impatiens glandulifera]
MNGASKAALLGSQANIFHARAALFHSTPVVDRKRRTYWESGGSADRETSKRRNYYAKRFRKLHAKQSLLRNASAFAEHIFQNWKDGNDDDTSLGQESSWFRNEFNGGKGGARRSSNHTKGQHFSARRDFNFCEDESDIETIFRSAFGGNKGFCWFVHDEFPPRGSSSSSYSNSYRTSWNWKHRDEDEEDYESSAESEYESNNAYLKLASDRNALGLSISGPLTLEDVKNAYRTCALKWHPDRHHGSSKAIAEEKFKTCSAAYQSLCDRMAVN